MHKRIIHQRTARSGFTLIELMIVIFIISILAALSAYVLTGAVTDAKIAKTKAQVTKLNQLLMERWESYETRQLQLNIPATAQPRDVALIRLWGIRELMRIEMPDRITDITTAPQAPFVTSVPALQREYLRQLPAPYGVGTMDANNESAECLYMIIASIQDEFGSAIDNFGTSDIGDTDGDGAREFVDAWGNPIGFIRWPAGYKSNVQKVVLADFVAAPPPGPQFDPDPLDPFRVDRHWASGAAFKPYLLAPLIFSAGPDESYDVFTGPFVNATTFQGSTGGDIPVLNYPYTDPYIHESAGPQYLQLGTPLQSGTPANYRFGQLDNIDNHFGVVE